MSNKTTSDRLKDTQISLVKDLQAQVGIFNELTHLLGQYRESKGIIVDPSVVITKVMSPQELAHTDILKEVAKIIGSTEG